MSLSTASARSGGGIDSNSRPAVVGRSGSANSNVSRTRTVGVRRETPSTSTMRPKLASQTSSTASSSQSLQSSSSLLSSIPRPSFPPTDAFDQIALDGSLVHARLLQLARHYLQHDDRNDESIGCDIHSASLYARLALQTNPTSLPARRILATTLLQGAQPFPFGPSSIHSSPLSLTSDSITPASSASISGAHAAIEVLKDGGEDVFMDIGCARIFAKACLVLGRTKEGKEAMAWTLRQTTERQRVNSSKGCESESVPDVLPPVFSLEGTTEACVHNDLAALASKSNRYEEAISHYSKAKSLDRWNWTAWVGLCDVGNDGNISKMFCEELHKPSAFYASQLESQLLNHNHDRDAIRKTIEELKAKNDTYYTASVGGSTTKEGESNNKLPLQKTTSNGTTSSLRKPVGNASTQTASMFPRAGTREDANAANVGTKRVRTTTAGSFNGGTVPRLANGGRNNISSAASTTDLHASKRPAVTSVRSKGPTASSQPTTTPVARAGGTLAAVRTNEQQRPTSSASGSSRGANEKVTLKPRRSARVNVAIIDEQEQQQQQPTNNTQKPLVSRPAGTATTGQVRRPAPRPVPSAQSVTDSDISIRKAPSTQGFTNDTLGSNKVLVNVMQTASFESARQAAVWNAVDQAVKELLQSLGMAYFAVKNFQCKSALILLRRKRALTSTEKAELKRELQINLDNFTGLDDCYRNSVDVQCLVARAYHDMSRFQLAEKHFLHARRLSPTLDYHMDIFSLTLFHLQREVALSRLARELSNLDSNSSVSHLAKGNTFALQREHSLALQSFQRACLAAPNWAYAFTLAGYEAFELGFKDRSVKYFRQAINVERRHWNAFAGLGRVYFESEHYTSSEYYYRRAITIHKTNPLLWDVYGSVLSAQEKFQEAEDAFEQAILLDSSLAMSHIKMAEVLLVQDQSQPEKRERAHEHLLEAVKHAPEEAHVHLMLAHTFMEKGNGSFARIDQGGNKRRMSSSNGVGMQLLLPSELQQLGTTGVSGPSSTARAVGNSKIPNEYQAEIAKHLCAAIDLDPRYVRYVKAMGEGAKAALRGIVSRFMMDGNIGPDGSTLLIDSSALLEGQTIDSMVDLDGDQVLEDVTALTDELRFEGEMEQGEDETGGIEEEISEIIDDSLAEDHQIDVENDMERHSTIRRAIEQLDVSMSF